CSLSLFAHKRGKSSVGGDQDPHPRAMDNDHVQPSKKRSFDAISREHTHIPDTTQADREGGGWQCSPSPHAEETISTDADAADGVGQFQTIPPVPHKEDASTGGRETGKCVESMIGAVYANRTGE
ncbi:unnamed protein product, partial [Ectocarpus sp. 6 AP-2014]